MESCLLHHILEAYQILHIQRANVSVNVLENAKCLGAVENIVAVKVGALELIIGEDKIAVDALHQHESILGSHNSVTVNVTLTGNSRCILYDDRIRSFCAALVDGISSVGSNDLIFDAVKSEIATKDGCAVLIALLCHVKCFPLC